MAAQVNAGPDPAAAILSAGQAQTLVDDAVLWVRGHYLQVLTATCAATLIVLAMIGLRGLGQRLCRRHTSLTHWPMTIGRVLAATQLWFMIAFAAKLVDGYATPPLQLARTIDTLFTIAAALQGALWGREFVLGVVEHRAGDDEHGAIGSAIGIIRLLVTIVLFAIAIVLILDNLGVNVTGLVAGLGIGGIAIGLAAKGIFDDLFSALSIIFDKPFRRGDAIRWDNTSGTVEAIGLKTTRVRATSGEEVVISNTRLLDKELHNMARLDRRRVSLTLRPVYSTPAEMIARIPAIARTAIEAQDKAELVRCGVTGFAPAAIEIEAEFDVHAQSWNDVFAARHAAAIAILAALETEGIVFAGPDGKAITPPTIDHRPAPPAHPYPQPSPKRRIDMADPQQIEAKFWKELKSAPFIMLGLDGARDGHAQPMTAVFEDDRAPLWFFTTKDNGLTTALGQSHRAIATYVGKGHDVFATLHGELVVETSRATLERLRNPHIEAWYEGGKDDPKLALLRLDAERAQIWLGGSTIGAAIDRLLGRDPKQDYKDKTAEVTL